SRKPRRICLPWLRSSFPKPSRLEIGPQLLDLGDHTSPVMACQPGLKLAAITRLVLQAPQRHAKRGAAGDVGIQAQGLDVAQDLGCDFLDRTTIPWAVEHLIMGGWRDAIQRGGQLRELL